MYCKNCGKEIANSEKVCHACGTPLAQSTENRANPTIVINNTNTASRGMDYPYKGKWIAFCLCLLLGWMGAHRFYVGKNGTGIIWLLTGGGFAIGWILDLILILIGAFRDKAGLPLK